MEAAPPNAGSRLALVRLPGRMRRALKLFRRITGLTAVTSLATSPPEPGTPLALSPPVHPLCAAKLHSVRHAPCGGQWIVHLRSSGSSPRARSHICPIGMRCACVPMLFGDQLVGIAKLVADGDTSGPAWRTALSALKLVVSGTCQDSAVSALTGELRDLRLRVTELQQIRSKGRRQDAGAHSSSAPAASREADSRSDELVDRALAHLHDHYLEPALSLKSVARAIGCNPRYLTTRFTQVVGERMHTYLTTLRVSHACRVLLSSELRVKEIAFASGFSGAGRLAGAFRTHVGVSPGEYRRIFTGL